jgi:hypothetical protein
LGEGENPFTKVRKGEINKAEKGKRGERKKRKIQTGVGIYFDRFLK